MTNVTFEQLAQAYREDMPAAALVLGSGLSELVEVLETPAVVPFAAIPGLTATSVAGHRGELWLGKWAGVQVLIYAGRLHYYEGHPWSQVLLPARVAFDLGARNLMLTNAAGGVRTDWQPGTLVLLDGQIECTRPGWHREFIANGEKPDRPFSGLLNTRFQEAAKALGWNLPTGVYAQMTGPCYETAAEVRALRTLGADVVGMSTAHEIRAAAGWGMQCAAISCVTNQAAGIQDGPIHHGEVLAIAQKIRSRLRDLLERVLVGLRA